MNLLSISSSSLGYRNNVVLRDINFEVQEDDWHILHGANGSGKSTFLRSLIGSLPLLNGQRTASPKLRLAYLPQAMKLDAVIPLTVFEVVQMGTWHSKKIFKRGTLKDHNEVEMNLKRVDISHLANRLFSELSAGQRQRVLLARAMCLRPQLLVLDEPTTALDAESRQRYNKSLQQLNADGTALVIATHDHEGWPDSAKHWVIGGGRLEVE
ncbi:MAG: metal ABC transporter ATP-binding protein [Planctomycetota bacterium]|nr:metal ABC transporter ATP-binding protein [Planctomycetota bacterium]